MSLHQAAHQAARQDKTQSYPVGLFENIKPHHLVMGLNASNRSMVGIAHPTFTSSCQLSTVNYQLSNPFLTNDFGEIDNPLTVAPLVVIPGDDFHHIITHDHRQLRINGTRGISTLEIARN